MILNLIRFYFNILVFDKFQFLIIFVHVCAIKIKNNVKKTLKEVSSSLIRFICTMDGLSEDLTTNDLILYNYALLTQVDVQGSFSVYKNILNHSRFEHENIKKYLIIQCTLGKYNSMHLRIVVLDTLYFFKFKTLGIESKGKKCIKNVFVYFFIIMHILLIYILFKNNYILYCIYALFIKSYVCTYFIALEYNVPSPDYN